MTRGWKLIPIILVRYDLKNTSAYFFLFQELMIHIHRNEPIEDNVYDLQKYWAQPSFPENHKRAIISFSSLSLASPQHISRSCAYIFSIAKHFHKNYIDSS